jgi:hypothetical protein
VYQEFENARDALIADFFARVTKILKNQRRFQSWEMNYGGGFFIERYAAYRLRKKAWTSKYDIRIEAYEYGNRMIYGVWRDKDQLPRVERNSALLQTVREKIPGVKLRSRDYFEAEITMDYPEPDWRRPKVLWRMAQDRKFDIEVADLLVEIADISERYVDRLV